MAARRRIHFLYILVGLVGIAFTVTACAYGVMAFRARDSADAYLAEADGGLMRLLRERGGMILAVEIAALALAIVAAIALDREKPKT